MSKTTEKTDTKPAGTLVRDPEQVALSKTIELLNALDATARRRVLDYLNSRFIALSKPSGAYDPFSSTGDSQ